MKQRIELGNLTIEWQVDQDRLTYYLTGDVDETFQHEKIPTFENTDVFLNLAGINHFNSIGIREWIHFIRRLGNVCEPIFEECSVNVIDQINMVPDTLGNGHVDSFYAPYYCSCGQESSRLIQVANYQNDLKKLEAPVFACECGQNLEFDAIEESYFQFLSRLPRVG